MGRFVPVVSIILRHCQLAADMVWSIIPLGGDRDQRRALPGLA